jgi:soluble lytic murein transglycosylase-like protein
MSCIKYIICIILMGISAISVADSLKNYSVNYDAAEALFLEYKKVPVKTRASILNQILKQSTLAGVNPNTVLAIAVSESSLNPNAIGKGKYSQGLMQVNLKFHREKFKGNPLNISENIKVGVEILKKCQDKAKGNLRKTMFCYRGLPSEEYYNTIAKRKKLGVFKEVK